MALDHVLGGDAGVVGARHPEDVVALHALPAAEDVLQGVVEGVSHVQGAGDVRGRNDDAVGFLVGGGGSAEVALALPFGIPSLLNVVRLIALGKFSGHSGCGTFSLLSDEADTIKKTGGLCNIPLKKYCLFVFQPGCRSWRAT